MSVVLFSGGENGIVGYVGFSGAFLEYIMDRVSFGPKNKGRRA